MGVSVATGTGPSGKALTPQLQQALAKVTEIGSLPEVTAQIVHVIEDPNATGREVQEAVQNDPALATKILKLVNSAFYGLPAQVASLERAIVMLGLSAVRNLALAASLSRLFKDDQISDQFSTTDLWQHSVAVGVCAKLLARTGGTLPGDEAFVAGLVHDMGLIVAQQLFRAQVKEIAERCRAEPQNFCALEETIIGADHQALGGALATKWKFPPGLCHAVAYHHNPSTLQPELQRVAALVYLADTICCQEQHGFWLTAQTQQPPEWMMKLTGITATDVETVTAELPQRLTEAQQIFTAGG
jgi:HD-like signal output (HDOD) protein